MAAIFSIGLAWAESAAGISWAAPASWQTQPARPMRAATYKVSPAAGDSEAAECAVYYFGQGQGGGVQANVDRWVGQFQGGKPQTKKRSIHGLDVTTVDVAGSYTGMGGPMMASKEVKPGYRMLAAMVETPQGNVFFKFTGPAKTVAANRPISRSS